MVLVILMTMPHRLFHERQAGKDAYTVSSWLQHLIFWQKFVMGEKRFALLQVLNNSLRTTQWMEQVIICHYKLLIFFF